MSAPQDVELTGSVAKAVPDTRAPPKTKPWRPILIINGASEETGRRIRTGTSHLGNAVDADDFHRIVAQDVQISTAIHNGARFPWISPAGTLTRQGSGQGHILDGGYFDAAGVATLAELAQAIAALPGRIPSFVFISFSCSIGYDGATEDSRPAGRRTRGPGLSTEHGGTLAAAPHCILSASAATRSNRGAPHGFSERDESASSMGSSPAGLAPETQHQ